MTGSGFATVVQISMFLEQKANHLKNQKKCNFGAQELPKYENVEPNQLSEAGQKGVPDSTISKDLYSILLEESKQEG